MTIAIEAEGLTKRYGDLLAVDDLRLSIEEGEIFGLLGPNGALFPIRDLPAYLLVFTVIDPVTYAVDGLRGLILSTSQLPILLNVVILSGFAAVMIGIGTWSFRRLKLKTGSRSPSLPTSGWKI